MFPDQMCVCVCRLELNIRVVDTLVESAEFTRLLCVGLSQTSYKQKKIGLMKVKEMYTIHIVQWALSKPQMVVIR